MAGSRHRHAAADQQYLHRAVGNPPGRAGTELLRRRNRCHIIVAQNRPHSENAQRTSEYAEDNTSSRAARPAHSITFRGPISTFFRRERACAFSLRLSHNHLDAHGDWLILRSPRSKMCLSPSHLFLATKCANVHFTKMIVRDAAAIETSRRSVLSLSKGETGSPGAANS